MPAALAPKRVDLHCHSEASNKTCEAVLNALKCPESYSLPTAVFEQARRRGMDFVALTDHDTIDGAMSIVANPLVLVGEEVTCFFPEDHCKMHILVYGITPQDHDALQSMSRDIYKVAEYIEHNNIAHSVAHPIYRQNDKLERWHVERLLLMFKGFECLNGAHSALHREAFEPLLDRLTRQEMARLSETHGLLPRWPEPHFKARTGGSDDHGLLNVGKTWTEFPHHVNTPNDLLHCIRKGDCRPGGEAGSSAKLAHTFYSVAVRYYTKHLLKPKAKPNFATTILQTLVGERAMPGKLQLTRLVVRSKAKKIKNRILGRGVDPKHDHQRVDLIRKLFLNSARSNYAAHPELLAAAAKGLPPLGEHAEVMAFVNAMNRDVFRGIADAIDQSIDHASFTGLFNSISAILGQQFVALPYYFALFHQNKERRLLRRITRVLPAKDNSTLKVGLFTDTFDDMNGVARFVRTMGEMAKAQGRQLQIHSCGPATVGDIAGRLHRKHFEATVSYPLPFYSDLKFNLPPVIEVMEWADRQQFDVVHVSTPGALGLVGLAVAKMLRAPLAATYHTDFPAYIQRYTNDFRASGWAEKYMRFFYGQCDLVLARSNAYRFKLMDLGVEEANIRALPAGVDSSTFSPSRRDDSFWRKLGVAQRFKVMYAGRVSSEKNLPVLVEAFKSICAKRDDVALVIAGDGPYFSAMKDALAGCPAHFLGQLDDEKLSVAYASGDVFAFPSKTDTLGQAVMEAQASGLPAIVTSEGGPKEIVADDETGIVLTRAEAPNFAAAIETLLNNDAGRGAMSTAAVVRSRRFSLDRSFGAFWEAHLELVNRQEHESPHEYVPTSIA